MMRPARDHEIRLTYSNSRDSRLFSFLMSCKSLRQDWVHQRIIYRVS